MSSYFGALANTIKCVTESGIGAIKTAGQGVYNTVSNVKSAITAKLISPVTGAISTSQTRELTRQGLKWTSLPDWLTWFTTNYKTFEAETPAEKINTIISFINIVQKHIYANKISIKTTKDRRDRHTDYSRQFMDVFGQYIQRYAGDSNRIRYYMENKDKQLNSGLTFLLSLNLTGRNNYLNGIMQKNRDIIISIGKVLDVLIEIENVPQFFEDYLTDVIIYGVELVDIEFFLSIVTYLLTLDLDTVNQDYMPGTNHRYAKNAINLFLKLRHYRENGQTFKVLDDFASARLYGLKTLTGLLEKVTFGKAPTVDIYKVVDDWISEQFDFFFAEDTEWKTKCYNEYHAGRLTISKLLAYILKQHHGYIYGMQLFDYGIYDDIIQQVLSPPWEREAIPVTQATPPVMLTGGDPFTFIASATAITYIVMHTKNVLSYAVKQTCKRVIMPATDKLTSILVREKPYTYDELAELLADNEGTTLIQIINDKNRFLHLSMLLSTMGMKPEIPIQTKSDLFAGEPGEVTLDILLDDVPESIMSNIERRSFGIKGTSNWAKTGAWGIYLYMLNITKQGKFKKAYDELLDVTKKSTPETTLIPMAKSLQFLCASIPQSAGARLRKVVLYFIIYANLNKLGKDYFQARLNNTATTQSTNYLEACCKLVAEAFCNEDPMELNNIFGLAYTHRQTNTPNSTAMELLASIMNYAYGKYILEEAHLLLSDRANKLARAFPSPFAPMRGGTRPQPTGQDTELDEQQIDDRINANALLFTMIANIASDGIKRAESRENRSSNTGNAPIINLDNPDIWRSKRERGRLVNAQTQQIKRDPELHKLRMARLTHTSSNSGSSSPGEPEITPVSPEPEIRIPEPEIRIPEPEIRIPEQEVVIPVPVAEERVETVLEDSLEHLEESKTVSNVKTKLLVFLNRMFEYKLFISPALFEAKLGYEVVDGLFWSPEYMYIYTQLGPGKQYFETPDQDKFIKFIDLGL